MNILINIMYILLFTIHYIVVSEETSNPTSKYLNNTRVDVQYQGRLKFYPGLIVKVNEDGLHYDINYDDGDTESNVHESFIRLLGERFLDEFVAPQIAANHWTLNEFYLDEEMDISDIDGLRIKYESVLLESDNDKYDKYDLATAHFELSLIHGGFGLLKEPYHSNIKLSWLHLMNAAKLGHPAALHKLATVSFIGYYGGYTVSTNIGLSIILDQLAAVQGYVPSHVSLGYKHAKGIGLVQSCENAISYYEYVANINDDAIKKRGYTFPNERFDVLFLERRSRGSGGSAEVTLDVMDYYHQSALEGDVSSATNLGNMYLYGGRTASQNITKSLYYYKLGYNWGGVQAAGLLGYVLVQLEIAHYRAYGGNEEIIRLYAKETKNILRYASNRHDPNGILGTAIAYMYGVAGFEKDINKSYNLLFKNPEIHPDAGYFLGEMLSGQHFLHISHEDTVDSLPEVFVGNVQIDFMKALQFYSISSRKGNILALHRVSQALMNGPPLARQILPITPGQTACTAALPGFRQMAEAEIPGVFHSPYSSKRVVGLTTALDAYASGDYLTAMEIFAEMASLGIDVAQTNAAVLLSRGGFLKGHLHVNFTDVFSVYQTPTMASADIGDSKVSSNETEAIALHLFTLSSAQGNLEAFLQMGDIYYYGKAGLASDKAVAVTHYQAGADLHHPHALFNLGLMYEVGDGVPQVAIHNIFQ